MDNKKKYATQDRWSAEHCTRVQLKFNNNTDADILALLDAAPSKQGLIKEAIRFYAKHMNNQKAE